MGDQEFLKAMGQRITARRKALGMTQEELAEKLDVSPQMISNLELGKRPFARKTWHVSARS